MKLLDEQKTLLVRFYELIKRVSIAHQVDLESVPIMGTVTFYGSGDDGCIDPIYRENRIIIGEQWLRYEDYLVADHNKTLEQAKLYINEIDSLFRSHGNIIYELCEFLIDSTGVDWYNEDGGDGELNITFSSNIVISLTVSVREQKSDTVFEGSDEIVELDIPGVPQLLAYYRNAERKKVKLDPYICAYFQGSGDSGHIEDIYFCLNKDDNFGYGGNDCDFLDKLIHLNIAENEEDKLMTVRDVIEEIAHRYIDSTGADWYNNSGGGGHFFLEFKNNQLIQHLSVWQNWTESEEMYDEQISL